MRRFLIGFLCATMTVLLSGWALAGPIAITNPGFEDVVQGVTLTMSNPSVGEWGYASPPGWTGGAGPTPPNAGVLKPIASISIPPEGLNVAWGNGPTIGQILGATLLPSTGYVLTVEVGERTDRPSVGYLVELLAGGVVLASDSGATGGPGGWLTSTVYYASPFTPPTGALEIRLSQLGGWAAGSQTLFDQVGLEAVPEPASFFLIGSGLFGLALVSRRLRKR
jgi:hypothetical protein